MATNANTSSITAMKAGQAYGRLTAVAFVRRGERGQAIWSFKCQCGNECEKFATSARRGLTRSCGCLKRETAAAQGKANETHGMRDSPEYNSWSGMIKRCYDTKFKYYNNYGGRGITVCERWRESFEAFFSDMGPKPSPKHSIDRIDNELGYSPSNCKWSTSKEQNRNRRDNYIIVVDGVSITLAEAVERAGLNYIMVYERLRRGWSVERSLSDRPRRF